LSEENIKEIMKILEHMENVLSGALLRITALEQEKKRVDSIEKSLQAIIESYQLY
jgi:ferritin